MILEGMIEQATVGTLLADFLTRAAVAPSATPGERLLLRRKRPDNANPRAEREWVI
jgi:hypothetical protein